VEATEEWMKGHSENHTFSFASNVIRMIRSKTKGLAGHVAYIYIYSIYILYIYYIYTSIYIAKFSCPATPLRRQGGE
jgi:hypothetical protein